MPFTYILRKPLKGGSHFGTFLSLQTTTMVKILANCIRKSYVTIVNISINPYALFPYHV